MLSNPCGERENFFFLAAATNSASETELKTPIWYETVKNL